MIICVYIHGVASGASRETCTTKWHRRSGATWFHIGCFARDIVKQTYNTSPPLGVVLLCHHGCQELGWLLSAVLVLLPWPRRLCRGTQLPTISPSAQ